MLGLSADFKVLAIGVRSLRPGQFIEPGLGDTENRQAKTGPF